MTKLSNNLKVSTEKFPVIGTIITSSPSYQQIFNFLLGFSEMMGLTSALPSLERSPRDLSQEHSRFRTLTNLTENVQQMPKLKGEKEGRHIWNNIIAKASFPSIIFFLIKIKAFLENLLFIRTQLQQRRKTTFFTPSLVNKLSLEIICELKLWRITITVSYASRTLSRYRDCLRRPHCRI